jgi:hypothetical protein
MDQHKHEHPAERQRHRTHHEPAQRCIDFRTAAMLDSGPQAGYTHLCCE